MIRTELPTYKKITIIVEEADGFPHAQTFTIPKCRADLDIRVEYERAPFIPGADILLPEVEKWKLDLHLDMERKDGLDYLWVTTTEKR